MQLLTNPLAIHPMFLTLKRHAERRGNRFVIALAMLALLIGACATSPDTAPGTDPAVDVGVDVDSRTEPAGQQEQAPVECSGPGCYIIIVNDSWLMATRHDGTAWDADGSLPEPYVALALNGKPLGTTTTLTEAQLLHYASIGAYRARWNEAVSTVELHVGDVLSVIAYDAQERYVLGTCELTLTATNLAAGQIACLGPAADAASLYFTIVPNA